MSKKKKNSTVINIGLNELVNGVMVEGETALDTKRLNIPIESLKVLMTGDSNSKFRIIKKVITNENVKETLIHRESGEKVKITIPIKFLEDHNIPYKHLVIPTNHQISGVLEGRVRAWEVEEIIKDLFTHFDLVIVIDKGSMKKIACKVPIQDIQQTKFYIEKCKNYSQIPDYSFEKIHLWRESAEQLWVSHLYPAHR